MKETVAAQAHKEVTADTDNKEADMVNKDMDNKVDMAIKDMVVMVNKDSVNSSVDKIMEASKADGGNMKDMVNSADMDNKDMDNKEDMAIKDTVDMVNKDTVDTADNSVDKVMEASKADGDNGKNIVNSADLDNKNTVDMDSNMKVNMVQTGTMANEDMMTTMNPGCRADTGVGRRRI